MLIKTNSQNKFNDILNLYILFILSVLIIYKLPNIAGIIFQVILLITFYRSQKDYFWLAFVFILENYPGALFSRYTGDMQHTFSLINRGSEAGTLYFWMFFLILALQKAIFRKPAYKLIIKDNIKLLTGYFLILVIIFGFYKWTAVTRMLLPWLFLIILPRLLRNEEDFHNFFNLMFSFLFLVLATQIFQIVFGLTVAKYLGGRELLRTVDELEGAIRPVDGIFIAYISLFGSLYYLIYKKKIFKINYLIIIVILSIFSIFLTATRTWLISAFFIFVGYFIYISRIKFEIIKKFSIPLILIIVLNVFVPFIYQQVELALKRYETLEYLLKGDVTAGGTLIRLDVRRPKVLSKFSESPIIGWGYGSQANKYSDEHVGNENLLMHTGIIGYSLWFLLWISFIFKMKNLNDKLSPNNPYKNLPKLFILFFIGILIINASAQWFNYLLGYLPGFTFIFLFNLASFVYQQAMRLEKNLINVNKVK